MSLEPDNLKYILDTAIKHGIQLTKVTANAGPLTELKNGLSTQKKKNVKTGFIKYCEGFVTPGNIQDDVFAGGAKLKYKPNDLQYYLAHDVKETKLTLGTAKGFILFAPKVDSSVFDYATQPDIEDFDERKRGMTYIVALCTRRTQDMPCIGTFLMSLALSTGNDNGIGLIVGRDTNKRPSKKAVSFYERLGFKIKRLRSVDDGKQIEDATQGPFMYREPPSADVKDIEKYITSCLKAQLKPPPAEPPVENEDEEEVKVSKTPPRGQKQAQALAEAARELVEGKEEAKQKGTTPVLQANLQEDIRHYYRTHDINEVHENDITDYIAFMYGQPIYESSEKQIKTYNAEVQQIKQATEDYLRDKDLAKITYKNVYEDVQGKLGKDKAWLKLHKPLINSMILDIDRRDRQQVKAAKLQTELEDELKELAKETKEYEGWKSKYEAMQKEHQENLEQMKNQRKAALKQLRDKANAAPPEKRKLAEKIADSTQKAKEAAKTFFDKRAEDFQKMIDDARKATEAEQKAKEAEAKAEQKAKELARDVEEKKHALARLAEEKDKAVAKVKQRRGVVSVSPQGRGDLPAAAILASPIISTSPAVVGVGQEEDKGSGKRKKGGGGVAEGSVKEGKGKGPAIASISPLWEDSNAGQEEVFSAAKKAVEKHEDKKQELAEAKQKLQTHVKSLAKAGLSKRKIAGIAALGLAGLFGLGLIGNMMTTAPAVKPGPVRTKLKKRRA